MPSIPSEELRFVLNRIRERLWVRPLVACGVSLGSIWAARMIGGTGLATALPEISFASVEAMLKIMTGSMLVIATFAVGAMVSAYGSASRNATPRSFNVLVADDTSQNALSVFVGAFIFSAVGLTALENAYVDAAGRSLLFLLTVGLFALVILTFVHWVDRIARLGRLETTIDTVEEVTATALIRRREAPTLHARPASAEPPTGEAVYPREVGYVQQVDIARLQEFAEDTGTRLDVVAMPGSFVAPDRPLARGRGAALPKDHEPILAAFRIGRDRVFDEDPRFGVTVLSEIASRALSPAMNDPGTAISIIGSLTRLFVLWAESRVDDGAGAPRHDRIGVPPLAASELFDAAFTSLARDGAALVEVAVRLQDALASLAATGDAAVREAAALHAQMALERAERALTSPQDLAAVRAASVGHVAG